MSSAIEILSSCRGGELLVLDGYLYHRNKQVDQTSYWECRERKHKKDAEHICTARIITAIGSSGHNVIGEVPLHNHEPDPTAVEAVKLRVNIKRRATEDSGPPARLLQKATADHPVSVQHRLSRNAQRKLVKRSRPTGHEEPMSLDNFILPEDLHTTLGETAFYRGEVAVNGEKALLFISNQDLNRLALARYWVADGTFDTVPGLFKQMFTVHGSVGPKHTNTVPMLFALMTSKTECLYREVLAKLSEVASLIDLELAPQTILTDFEKGMINAFHHEFPEAAQVGCFFHFSQNLWKKVQKSGLVPHFNVPESGLYDGYKKIQALAFLPPTFVAKGYHAIQRELPQLLQPVVKYVEETYILGRLKPGRKGSRTQPLFPASLWSVYKNVTEGIPRTTNQVESWHSRWAKLVGAKHVGTIRIVQEIRLEQKSASGRAEVFLAGGGEEKRNDYVEKDKRLRIVVENFKNYDLCDYITAIVANLHN